MLQKKYDRTDTQMCGNCKGSGVVQVSPEPLAYTKVITCPICEGACLVSVRKETTVTVSPKILVRS